MKKNLIITFLFCGILFTACGQKLKESQVPAVTKTAFSQQYPGIKARWEKEDGNYEVSFEKDRKNMSMIITGKGTVLETETDITIGELPAPVASYVKQHYSGAMIKGASKILKPNNEVIYEATVKGKDVLFDVNGNFLKEVKE